MARFDSGIKFYTSARLTLHFPEDKVCCRYCPLMGSYNRETCKATGEVLYDINTVGYNCPLEPIKENDDGELFSRIE